MNRASLLLVSLAFGLATAIACEETPGPISISVSGAQAGDTQNYYVVEIPDQGKTTVTVTGSGQTPCPTDEEKCSCQHNTDKLTPEEDGDPKFTFSPKGAGTQDPNNGPSVVWEVDSSTSPGEYKFKVTKIEQAYKACPQGWSGGIASKSNTQESEEVTILVAKVELEIINSLTLLEGWGLKAKVHPSNNVATNFKFEVRRKNGTSWTEMSSSSSEEFDEQARAAGFFEAKLVATIKGVDLESKISQQIEVKFPPASDISADAIVEAQRSVDWQAASGPNGDHNERGGWVYLNSSSGTYRIDAWPVGTFVSVSPGGNPAEAQSPCDLAPNSSMEYFVGEYHLHATLMNQNDINNAHLYPTGPSPADTAGANSSIAPSGAPGLLRDRHQNEIVETGHTDHTYGPNRRATPNCP
jgi:hypothetical protein